MVAWLSDRISALFASDIEAAGAAKLRPERLRAIASGAPPTAWELANLAAALAVEPSALRRSIATEDPRRSLARFRATEGPALSGHDTRLLARAAEAGRTLAFLAKTLGEGPSPVLAAREVRGISRATEPWQQGYDLGRQARSKLLPDRKPIPSLSALLESWGVHVAYVRFYSGEIEAASLHEPAAAPVILVNQGASGADYAPRLRAILAHELCHLLHDGGERDLVTVVSSRRGAAEVSEQRAGGFAPNFLAPGDWIEPRPSDPWQRVKEIAEQWGLSFEGAAWHAKNLKLVAADVAEKLANGPRPSIAWPAERAPDRTPPDMFGIESEPTDLSRGNLSETAILAEEGGDGRTREQGRALPALRRWGSE